jgi:hypothetical protein
VFITSVLSEITVDEILGLSLEDFRHLNETLDEAGGTLEQHLPQQPEFPELPEPARPVLQRPSQPAPAARRRSSVPVLQAVIALFAIGVLIAILIFLPNILDAIDRGSVKGVFAPRQAKQREPEPRASTAQAASPKPAPKASSPERALTPKPTTEVATAPVPTFAKQPPPEHTTVPPEKAPPEHAPETTPRPAVKRVFSRWQVGDDGWITLFNGKSLDGLNGSPDYWSVRDGALYGIAPDSAATLGVEEAKWTDYGLALEAMLGKEGALVIGHGDLTARISGERARLSNPQRVLDERQKGLSRKKWYRIELDVKGNRAEARVNGQQLLVTAAHTPAVGAPTIEVQQGGIAIRSMRLQLHPTDPDYRAVVLREGYLVPATSASAVEPSTAQLGLGTHVLFNGSDLNGWSKVGEWKVDGGALVGRALGGQRAILAAGSPEWQDYTLTARCRLTRQSRMTREGEYFLLIVRYKGPESFYCVRFPIEGIFEAGYCYRGRFRETGRGRHGLANRFNQWRDIQVSMRGEQLTLVIDSNPYPAWTFKGLRRGGVALGVEGGEAAFQNVRVQVLR